MKRKLFYGLLAAVLCCGILTGCGGKASGKTENGHDAILQYAGGDVRRR